MKKWTLKGLFAWYHQNKITFSTINNQPVQLNVAVKSSIIGDDYEVSKKRKQENWLCKKTQLHLPSPPMISLLV